MVKEVRLVRVRDILMAVSGWISEMGMEEKLPVELDEELADLLRELDEELED